MKWSYCVEMAMPGASSAGWQVMHGRGIGGLPLVDVTRAEATERASKLPRHGGRFVYRVRRFCRVKS